MYSRTVVAACLFGSLFVATGNAFSPLRRDAWYPLLQRTLTVDGSQPRDGVGTATAPVPNFTRDGGTQVAVGAPNFNPGARPHAGAVLVSPATAPGRSAITPSTTDGTFLFGDAGDNLGASVANAGDVNGDGLGDLIIGAPGAPFAGRELAGEAFVVFGGRSRKRIDVHALGNGGFTIGGAAAQDSAGYSVAGLGDVNGDGLDDLLVGAPSAAVSGRAGSGAAYVVFGKANAAPVDLASLGAGGIRISGGHAADAAGAQVSAAGDFDGDGTPDAVVAAPDAAPGGAVYLVDDLADGDVDLRSLGNRGLTLLGSSGRPIGASVAGVGDTNGDGRADLAAGSPSADVGTRNGAGVVYVVFGTKVTGAVHVSSLKGGGFVVEGAEGLDRATGRAGDQIGTSVAGAGDVDGDTHADVLIGAPQDQLPLDKRGSAWVVYGKANARTVDLRHRGGEALRVLDSQGAVGSPARHSALLGQVVAGAGDVTGDGLGDLLIGAPLARTGAAAADGSRSGGMVILLAAPRLQISHGSVLSGTKLELAIRCLSRTITCAPSLAVRAAQHRHCGGVDVYNRVLASGSVRIKPRAFVRVRISLSPLARRQIDCVRRIPAVARAQFGASARTATAAAVLVGGAEAPATTG